MAQMLLEVDDLKVEFATRDGVARAVNGVSFTVERGRPWPSWVSPDPGKSVTAQAIMGILDTPPARIAGGSIKLRGARNWSACARTTTARSAGVRSR